VGLEWAHTKCLSQGEGVLIVALGLLDLRRLALCGDVAEEE
jgi:hypothetical protein